MGRLTRKGFHNGLAGFWVKEINGTESFISWEDDGYTGISKLDCLEDLKEQGKLIEQKHGRWIEHEGPYFKCSVCGISEVSQGLYCRNCGAKMFVKEEAKAKLRELNTHERE